MSDAPLSEEKLAQVRMVDPNNRFLATIDSLNQRIAELERERDEARALMRRLTAANMMLDGSGWRRCNHCGTVNHGFAPIHFAPDCPVIEAESQPWIQEN